MFWPFWRKQEEPYLTKLQQMENQLSTMHEQMSSAQEQISELEQLVQKLTRLQYKTGKTMEEKMDDLALIVNEKQEKAFGYDPQVIDRLIQQIDELDLVYANLAKESEWANLIQNWTTSLLDILADLGMHSCVRLGEVFDPTCAEAVQTVSIPAGKEDSLRPYQIVDIYKRGFSDSDGQVIRKAQVVTVRGEN